MQNGLLVRDRESVELSKGGGCFDETIGETSSSQSGKILDGRCNACGELFFLVPVWHF